MSRGKVAAEDALAAADVPPGTVREHQVASCHFDPVKCHRKGKPKKARRDVRSVQAYTYRKARKGLRRDTTTAFRKCLSRLEELGDQVPESMLHRATLILAMVEEGWRFRMNGGRWQPRPGRCWASINGEGGW